MKKLLTFMLAAAMLPALGQAQTVNICDRTAQVRDAILSALAADDCAAVDSEGLAGVRTLGLESKDLTTLQAGDFAGLTSLEFLQLQFNRLAELPEGVFNGLASLETLFLFGNQLTTLPEGLFAGLTGLRVLILANNQLTTLPEGLFADLTGLFQLFLSNNQFAELPEGLFVGLTGLSQLFLGFNQLTTLQAGDFDGLTNLNSLSLSNNQLTALPDGVFDGLTNLYNLYLNDNYLVGLARTDPALAGIPSEAQLRLGGQTEPRRIAAAVPLMVSASDSMRQGFVRIVNRSDESGSFRILAFDDAGNAAEPIEVELGANQAMHFNSDDLENGNAAKGINAGVGSPTQGDWRLDVETALGVRVLSYIRTNDGFLTVMHDRLPRNNQGGLRFGPSTPPVTTQGLAGCGLLTPGGMSKV